MWGSDQLLPRDVPLDPCLGRYFQVVQVPAPHDLPGRLPFSISKGGKAKGCIDSEADEHCQKSAIAKSMREKSAVHACRGKGKWYQKTVTQAKQALGWLQGVRARCLSQLKTQEKN